MVGLSEEDKAVLSANCIAHGTGLSKHEIAERYNEWAVQESNSYDEGMKAGPMRYNGPTYAAETLAKYLADKKDARILDVAAGTGFVGEELSKRGFTNIDALDPAAKMLSVAAERNVYKNLFCEFWDVDVKEIGTDSYDALGIAGGMGEGHIPVESISEMIRVVIPGGIVVIVMRENYLKEVEQYKELESLMQRLELEGKWSKLERTVVEKYSFGNNGVIFVFRVL